MAVAAVLAQQRQAVPQHQMRFGWPVEVGVSGIEGTALGAAAAGGLAHQLRDRGQVRGGDDVGAEQPGQGRIGGSEAGHHHGSRAGQLPRPGDALGDEGRAEVVERGRDDARADGSHGGGAAGEVAHPPGLEPDADEPLLGLRNEVDHRVQDVGRVVRLPDEGGVHCGTVAT